MQNCTKKKRDNRCKKKRAISNYYRSIIIVTGPSFNNWTFISAPKIPFCTSRPFRAHSLQKYSYNGIASSGLAASIKLGLFPSLQSPYNVNHIKDVIIFAFVGAVIAVSYVLVSNMLDTTIKSEDDIEKIFKQTVLATMPLYDGTDGKKRRKN